MRTVTIIFLFWIMTVSLPAQVLLTDQLNILTCIDHTYFQTAVVHDEPLAISDHPFVSVFKSYFNPVSFEAYKSFFLPSDWGGFSQEEFDVWQSSIKAQKLFLNHLMHLRDNAGHEFLVFQYNMETSAYSIPQSAKFKKVNGEWKHIHVRHDAIFSSLNNIGKLKVDFLNSGLEQTKGVIRVDQARHEQQATNTEKFDRQEVFDSIETWMQQNGIEVSDIETAKTYFLQKDDRALIELITSRYAHDQTDVMDAINTTTGLRLFNFVRAKKD